MKTQTYYITETERAANICDRSCDLMINCAGVVNNSMGINTSSVRNDFYLMYMLKGKMNIELGEKKTLLSEGQLLIIKAGTYYHYRSKAGEEICYLWLHFTGRNAEKVLYEYSLKTNNAEYAGIHGEIFSLWQRMFREFIINDEYFNTASCSVFNQILTELSRYILRSDKKERILKSITYIHENYNRKLSVKELAEMEELSPSYYRAYFKNVTGVSPSQYLMARKMDVAVEMLENSNMKISEIAELAGYADPYYFERIFKKRFGISPGKFRKQNWHRREFI